MKTVGELIAELQKYPDHFKVVMSRDPEGNGFYKYQDIGYGIWDQDSSDNDYFGEFTSWTYDDWDNDQNTERALTLDESDTICLWP
jgi:hypothetical protein